MTKAEMHVAALLATFGPLPIIFETLGATVTSLEADDEVLRIGLFDDFAGKWRSWVYPDPETWLLDPAGDVPRTSIAENDQHEMIETTVMGRIDPVAVATTEFARQLGLWRA
jgi:hypothetical protein